MSIAFRSWNVALNILIWTSTKYFRLLFKKDQQLNCMTTHKDTLETDLIIR